MPLPPRNFSGDLSSGGETARFWQAAPDILCVLHTASGIITRANPAWNRVLGLSPEQVNGRSLLQWTHPDDRSTLRALLTPTAREAHSNTVRIQNQSGDYRWLQWSLAPADGKPDVPALDAPLWVASARDVTELWEEREKMRWQANHDSLTGLPNRNLLEDHVNLALAGAQRRGHRVGVLFLDLDRFKPINDMMGHAVGDMVLKELAARLRHYLRQEDTIARLGGDEFIVLLPVIRSASDALQVGRKLLEVTARPFHLAGHTLHVTVSIGVSIFPGDGETAAQLIHNADVAMYRSKREGRGRLLLFHEDISGDAQQQLMLRSRLSQAVDRDELRLHYQPQISVSTGRMVGVEALMRWQYGEGKSGLMPPGSFIPIAEETGLIIPMGAWAMEEACRQGADWHQSGLPLRVAVNLSAYQLTDTNLPRQLAGSLDELGFAPHHLDLELTESTFIRNEPGAVQTLGKLKDMGVGLSVDDFGTGYSSLAYLRRFPLDKVKVDRSFISQVDHNAADEAVVHAVIDLSHTLGLRVVAEGVETAAQRDKLTQLGCDEMQGYFFSAAVPPREVEGLFAARVA